VQAILSNGYLPAHHQISSGLMPVIPTNPPQNFHGLTQTTDSSTGGFPSSSMAFDAFSSSSNEPNQFYSTFHTSQQQNPTQINGVGSIGYSNSSSTIQQPPLSPSAFQNFQGYVHPQSTSSWENDNDFGQVSMGGSVEMSSSRLPGTSVVQGTTSSPPFGDSMPTMSSPSHLNGLYAGSPYAS
jgi:hypothetical protein